MADNTVSAWGWNNEGQLGDGTRTGTAVSVPVRNLGGVTEVEGGYLHSLAK